MTRRAPKAVRPRPAPEPTLNPVIDRRGRKHIFIDLGQLETAFNKSRRAQLACMVVSNIAADHQDTFERDAANRAARESKEMSEIIRLLLDRARRAA